MKKTLFAAFAAVFALTLAVWAATYKVIEIKSTSRQAVAGMGVVLAKYVDVSGALPGNATVVVSRVSGVATTAVATVACTAGKGAAAATANIYLIDGDYLYYTRGHATNYPTARLIVEGE